MSVRTMIYVAYEGKPIKAQGGNELVTRLAQMLNGWRKEDPPNKKKVPLRIDILEFFGRVREG